MTPAVALALLVGAALLLLVAATLVVVVLDRDTTTGHRLAAWAATLLVLSVLLAHVTARALLILTGGTP